MILDGLVTFGGTEGKCLSTIGKATRGYDPSVDIAWLKSEIVNWVLGNLMNKW